MYPIFYLLEGDYTPVSSQPRTGASQAFVVFFVAYVTIIVFAVLRASWLNGFRGFSEMFILVRRTPQSVIVV